MPGSEVLVQIALGVAVILAALAVLRWAWNSRQREGKTAERVDALERAILDAGAREKRVRKQEGLSHGEWKRQGKRRRVSGRKPAR